VYDYDRATGAISNRRTIVREPGTKDTCDGMTVDADGNLWSAWWGDGYVRQYTAEGKLLRAIKLPASRISSCTFGGPNLDELFLTTAMDKSKVEHDGALLRIRGLGVKGRPEFRSRIGL
jgi:D-xylonolactonase